MALFDLFSKRQRRLRGDAPDVYTYDAIPGSLRVQVIHILRDTIGQTGPYHDGANNIWRLIHDALSREYGMFRLADGRTNEESAIRFFLDEKDFEKAVDFIDMSFRCVDRLCREPSYQYAAQPTITADAAIEELNSRFREAGIGFEFISGEIIRIDSHLVHAQVIKPALQFLRDKYFAGANTEYLRAHEHYRSSRYEEALADCLKAFESTMKAICHKRRWSYDQNDTAKRLIEVVFANELIPSYLQSEFAALRTSLESGVPTVRNKQSGHGQGVQPRDVPRHLAAYLLNLTAANILLLAEADNNLA